jgi:hypothetical protein
MPAQFQPCANGVAVSLSTTSTRVQLERANGVAVSSHSEFWAWLTWSDNPDIEAVYPVVGDAEGQWGMDIPPGSQTTLATAYSCDYYAIILEPKAAGADPSGAGFVTLTPGDGL